MCMRKQIKLQYRTVNYKIATTGSHQPVIQFGKLDEEKGATSEHI